MSETVMAALPHLIASVEAELARQSEDCVVSLDRVTGACCASPAEALAMLERPQSLPPERVFGFWHRGELNAALPLRYGFSLNWVAQPASGKLEGQLGLPVEAAWVARVELTLAGPFLCTVWRDEDERVRIRLKPGRQGHANFLRAVFAEAGSEAAETELLAALLDAHPLQAFEALLDKAARGRADERLTRLLDFWRGLDHRAAAALWRACGATERLNELRDWLRCLEETPSPEDFGEDLAWKPPRPGWPAEAFMETLAGTLLDGVLEVEKFERLREAARATNRLLGEPGLLGLLEELRRRAAEQTSAGPPNALADPVRETMVGLQSGAVEALQNKLAAELNRRAQAALQQAPWLDAAFDFSRGGAETYQQLLRGRFSLPPAGVIPGVRLHASVLTHGLRRQDFVEVHLPLLDRKPWSARLEALAGARVETTLDGRLVVRSPEEQDEPGLHDLARDAMSLCAAFVSRPAQRDARFDLSWSCTWEASPLQARWDLRPLLAAYRFDAALGWLEQVLPETEQIQAQMALSVPGAMAGAWLEAPGERSPNYKEAYAEMSVAVQQALRTWLPFSYFRDLTRYDTLNTACPLIVYRCTLPFRSKARSEFAYDIMSAESVAVARRSTGMALAAELARIEQLLLAAGKAETARSYRPSRREVILAGVERAPRLFHSLLVTDALLIDHLIRFGVRAGGVRRALEHEPQRAMRELVKFGEELVKTFQRRLRRLYGGEDFRMFGPLILIEATRGLNRGLGSQTRLNGMLRLLARLRDGGTLGASFVNAGFEETTAA